MIPQVDDLGSAPMTHRFGDCFNAPGLTNFLGCVQVTTDLACIRCLSFPPFATAEVPTASLMLDGWHFPALGRAVTITWYPDRVVREASYKGLYLSSTTALAVGKMAVVMEVAIENRSGAKQDLEVGLRVQGGITRSAGPWSAASAPSELDNVVEIDRARAALVFRARRSKAVCLQGTWPRAARQDRSSFRHALELAPGARQCFHYVHVTGEDEAQAGAVYDALIRDVPGELARARASWNAELKALFAPESDSYSGCLPVLVTNDADIRKLYWMGALGVAYLRREGPYSAHGRTYDTLMPRYWQTAMVLWDYALSAPVHALLDPSVLKASLERWMRMDVHRHFGTEYLTGSAIGPWYAVNDYAMVRMACAYVRWSGDVSWLRSRIEGTDQSVYGFLVRYALSWRQFSQPSGLASYGSLFNLLECVSSYTNEVASLNAASVFCMRAVAQLADALGDGSQARELRLEASRLVARILPLYVKGRGFWRARQADGTLRAVRHCYDLLTVLNTIADDLTARQKSEMTDFFRRELQTETWMHALSPLDEDVLFSVRPDHQWTGAYPAWPPEIVRGLYRIGEVDLAFGWLKQLARSANQGPFGQAHFADSVMAPEAGGARKAPSGMPYINDWHSSSSGSWVGAIVQGIFGLRPAAVGALAARPQFGKFDPEAELLGIAYHGRRFGADKDGVFPME